MQGGESVKNLAYQNMVNNVRSSIVKSSQSEAGMAPPALPGDNKTAAPGAMRGTRASVASQAFHGPRAHQSIVWDQGLPGSSSGVPLTIRSKVSMGGVSVSSYPTPANNADSGTGGSMFYGGQAAGSQRPGHRLSAATETGGYNHRFSRMSHMSRMSHISGPSHALSHTMSVPGRTQSVTSNQNPAGNPVVVIFVIIVSLAVGSVASGLVLAVSNAGCTYGINGCKPDEPHFDALGRAAEGLFGSDPVISRIIWMVIFAFCVS